MFIRPKDLLRSAYRGLVGASVFLSLPFRSRDKSVAVSYAGARSGDFGGTLVKVRLLQKKFPERRIGFSLLYMLSNAIYLPAAVAGRLRAAGVPLVLNQNGIFYPGWYPQGWERENARMAAIHAMADHVFYQSEFCRRCAEQFLGPRGRTMEILYNAVNTGHFTPRPSQELERRFQFLVTGKFGPSTAYRLRSSVEGLATARAGGLDIGLRIAGAIDPAVEAGVRTQVDRLGLNAVVDLTGPYNGAQAPDIYRSADAYLMLKYNDPCPNTVLEAMACGLPVLYSESGGVPELVGPEAGLGLPMPQTFEEDLTPSPEAIAEGMAHVMRHREQMAPAARRRSIERFDLTHWYARHESVFRSLLGKAQ